MASHFQEDLVANKGDDFGMGDTTHVQPKGSVQDTHGSENGLGASTYADHEANPVLESEAQTKGKWFAYVKTKQFWLAMLLGQGE
jgi:solute carrier family 35 protein F1/2